MGTHFIMDATRQEQNAAHLRQAHSNKYNVAKLSVHGRLCDNEEQQRPANFFLERMPGQPSGGVTERSLHREKDRLLWASAYPRGKRSTTALS